MFEYIAMHYSVFQSKTMYYRLRKCTVVYRGISQMLRMYCSLLMHVTAHNVVVQVQYIVLM